MINSKNHKLSALFLSSVLGLGAMGVVPFASSAVGTLNVIGPAVVGLNASTHAMITSAATGESVSESALIAMTSAKDKQGAILSGYSSLEADQLVSCQQDHGIVAGEKLNVTFAQAQAVDECVGDAAGKAAILKYGLPIILLGAVAVGTITVRGMKSIK